MPLVDQEAEQQARSRLRPSGGSPCQNDCVLEASLPVSVTLSQGGNTLCTRRVDRESRKARANATMGRGR